MLRLGLSSSRKAPCPPSSQLPLPRLPHSLVAPPCNFPSVALPSCLPGPHVGLARAAYPSGGSVAVSLVPPAGPGLRRAPRARGLNDLNAPTRFSSAFWAQQVRAAPRCAHADLRRVESVSVACSAARFAVGHAARPLPPRRGESFVPFRSVSGAELSGPNGSWHTAGTRGRSAVGSGRSGRCVLDLGAHLKARGLNGDLSQNWLARPAGSPASLWRRGRPGTVPTVESEQTMNKHVVCMRIG